MWYYFLNVR